MAKRTNKPAKLKAPKGDPAKWPDAEQASDTVKKIQEKTKEVEQLAAAIELSANEAKRKSLAERVAAARAKAKLAGPVPDAEGSK